jgi:hypothetical protein
MAVLQGRTRAELRQSIGYNLGSIYVSSASGLGSTTSIVDNTLVGGDDNHNGKWVIFNDADGTSGQTTRVSNYTSSSTTLALSPAIAAGSVASDTYELWDDIYNPSAINEFINQSILDATGVAWDPVESLALHTDGTTLRYDVPSGMSMVKNIYYRNKVSLTRLHACAATFDETVDSDFTVSLDTKDKKQGSQSCKFVIAAGASAGDIATDSITSKDISGYDYIEFWVKSTVATSAGNLKILLDDSASCASPIETLSVPALSADTWTFCRVALANPETDTAIISVGLEYDSDIGAVTVWLDDISVVKNDSADWIKLPRNLWRIDKEAKDIVFEDYAHGIARYNLLKIVGGDKPVLLTSDSATPEIDEQYIIAMSTGLALASVAGGPSTDPDAKNNKAGFWMRMAATARRAFPVQTNVRLVE